MSHHDLRVPIVLGAGGAAACIGDRAGWARRAGLFPGRRGRCSRRCSRPGGWRWRVSGRAAAHRGTREMEADAGVGVRGGWADLLPQGMGAERAQPLATGEQTGLHLDGEGIAAVGDPERPAESALRPQQHRSGVRGRRRGADSDRSEFLDGADLAAGWVSAGPGGQSGGPSG